MTRGEATMIEPRYSIEPSGNGAFWTVTRLRDGATVCLRGADALEFSRRLRELMGFAEELCAEYDDVMTLPGKDGAR